MRGGKVEEIKRGQVGVGSIRGELGEGLSEEMEKVGVEKERENLTIISRGSEGCRLSRKKRKGK